MRRRLKSAALVIAGQILLVALAFAWLIHMAYIAAFGSISFVEDNPLILWGEIIASGLIMVFAVYVLVTQIKRLGERRSGDRAPAPSPAGAATIAGRPRGATGSLPDTPSPQGYKPFGK
jgi:hypothetical protein